jgi:hypothetical protein
VASGVPGTSTICTTAQGILGYVKVASNPNQFRDQELFGLTAAITVRVAARRHHHDHTHADLDDGTLG